MIDRQHLISHWVGEDIAGSKTTDCTDIEVAPAPERHDQRVFVPGPSRITQQWRRLSRKTKKTRISS